MTKPLEPVLGVNAMVADFTATSKNAQAAAYKFTFEVDEQDAQRLLDILGGLPVSGESRPVIIWRPTIEEIRQARQQARTVGKKLKATKQKALPKPEEGEENEKESE